MTVSSLGSQLADESTIREQVLSTHNCDGRDFDANFILGIVENILSLHTVGHESNDEDEDMDDANQNFETREQCHGDVQEMKKESWVGDESTDEDEDNDEDNEDSKTGEGTAEEAMAKKLKQLEELNYKELPFHIKRLSFKIASGLNAANQHWTIIHVLTMLSSYSWDAKLVLTLSAFSVICGEFCLVSRFRKRKGLARKLAQLKQSRSNPTPSSDNQKVVVDCLSSFLELTKCVVELKQTPSYSTPQSVISALPMAIYWIGRSIVNSAASCAHFEVPSELAEVTTLTADILATFSPELEKKKAEESYKALQHALHHNSSNKSNVFRLMFNVKDDDEEIFNWSVRL